MPLARLSEASATGSTSGDAFVSSYLVAAENVPAFRKAVGALEEAHPELTIVFGVRGRRGWAARIAF